MSAPKIDESRKENHDVKRCEDCGFFEKVKHEAGGCDDWGTYFDHSYLTYSCRKFGFDINKSNQDMADKCSRYIEKGEYKEKCLNGEIKLEQSFQIVLDFSSLKDAMTRGGIVMTTYKCPNCNGVVDIPENGKVLICKYCGSPIKPVDIFEKIKSLVT